MSNFVAIIGTSHLYQFGGAARTAGQNQAFEELIRRTCNEHAVRCLAEEMSHDALRAQNRLRSTVEAIAGELGLTHIYCDPSEADQRAMGLSVERSAAALKHLQNWSDQRIFEKVAAEHRQRERFWSERLQEKDVWPCLFVCGSEHAVHFCSLLSAAGFQAHIVAEAWDA